MSVDSMNIAQPAWLLVAVAAIPVLAAGLWWERRRRRQALARIASPELLDQLSSTLSPTRRALKRLLVSSTAILTLAALARPQWGFHTEQVKREGIELMFAIDTSKSMLAQDFKPNRITRAKLAVADLVRKFQGDRVGLIAFAGDAFLQVPMTLDRDVFEDTLRALKPGVVPVGGSDLASAIREADRAFEDAGNGQRLLVLMSDGEDLEGAAVSAAEQAAEHGVMIYTVGVGGTDGEVLTVPDGRGGTTVVRDATGTPVTSRLDESTLTRIAEATGGAYVPLGPDGMGLERLYQSHLANLEKHEIDSRSSRVYHDRFAWLLIPALLFALVEPFIGERRRQGLHRAPLAAAVALLAVGLVATASPALAAQDPKLTYNEGISAYQSEDWDGAMDAFEESVAAGPVGIHQRSWYNLGNARYRAGQAAQRGDNGDTRELWEAALDAYDTAIELDPEDQDASYNRDFVARQLDQLEEPPPEPNDQTCDNPKESEDGKNPQDTSNANGEGETKSGEEQTKSGEEQTKSGEEQTKSGEDETRSGEGSQPSEAREDSQDQREPQEGSSGEPDDGEQPQSGSPGAPEPGEPEAAEPRTGGLAAARPGEDGSMSPEQAAALVRTLGGDASTIPIYVPDTEEPRPRETTPNKDW